MHYYPIKDATGDLVDLVPFCSDSCHRDWCNDHGAEYGGWNGCQEGGDYAEFCAQCGVFAGGTAECDHQSDNIVVNRFICDNGEKCECGHWIQLPAKYLKIR
jgi:hypothetical protein